MFCLSIWQGSKDLMIYDRREYGVLLCVSGWTTNIYNFEVGLWPWLLKFKVQ